jgi:hypothetical protein
MTRTLPAWYTRYKRRLFAAMSLYGVAVFGVPALLSTGRIGPARQAVLSVVPAIPLIAAIGVVGRLVSEITDEYQRSLLIRDILWATGGVLALSTAWGFMEAYGTVRHGSLLAVPIVWFSLMGVFAVARRITDR